MENNLNKSTNTKSRDDALEKIFMEEAMECGVQDNIAKRIKNKSKNKNNEHKNQNKRYDKKKERSKEYKHETIREMGTYLAELEKEELTLEEDNNIEQLFSGKTLSFDDLKNM